MRSATEDEIRASFANCTQGEASRIPMPRDLTATPWPDLDFLGWRDLGAPDRAYLVAPRGDDDLIGIALRTATTRKDFLRRNLCSLCFTTHQGGGVALMTGRKAGDPGRQGNSVGLYMCTDLSCSLYIRGTKSPGRDARMAETLSVEQQIDRMMGKLEGFFKRLAV
ncbi:FBP domain-containing protein [Catenulispora yoronensis]|uniref:FBP domain-containing protein n=1 Tax=Catenulispora yoronensis TaxID=450799 RepID=A0ABN2U4N4_9ACTN